MKKILAKGLAALLFAGALGCTKGVTLPSNPKPHSHQARGIYLGLPELVALRYVYGWDKRCGFQANIGPIFGSADLRVKKNPNSKGYGLLGVTALMPWAKDIVEEELKPPLYCPEFGVGFETGKKKGLAVGCEFAIIIPLEEQKQEEESGTVGFRFGVSVVKRY